MSDNGQRDSRSLSRESGRSGKEGSVEGSAHSGHSAKSQTSSRSPSKSRSRSRSRSRSYSRSHKRRRSKSGGHYKYSRSRSRSPYERRRSRSRSSRHRRRSRSRSRSPSDRNHRDRYSSYRSRSKSPMSSRRRHFGNRDDPEPSKCCGVFGLSLYTQERTLRDVFSRYGELDEVQIVYDRQTGRSRGFAFVYFKNIDDSIEHEEKYVKIFGVRDGNKNLMWMKTWNLHQAKDRCNGLEIDGRRIRVDYSITNRAHTPTPGIYLGKPAGARSPSPYGSGYKRKSRYSRSRSRSRSYSPRFEERNLKLEEKLEEKRKFKLEEIKLKGEIIEE